MNYTESSPAETPKAKDVGAEINKLLDGPPSSNYNLRQMQLAVEKFVTEHPEETLDHDRLESITFEWANNSKWSKAFSDIVHNPAFQTHPRFQGNIKNITLEDVHHQIETGEMPL
ncbi:MAG: hypothetical protein WCS89_00500 [Candidatus Paceibacterota bacterium]|jgi:hypothetical protein